MPSLSAEQKHEVCLIVSIGCALDTAARYAGCRPDAIGTAVLEDPAFARDLARAEAGIELAHMRAVQQAARDERHWRASAWWLERKSPDHYARRQADAVSPAELKTVLTKLSEAIAAEIASPDERRRLLRRLEQVADEHETGELSHATSDDPENSNPGDEDPRE